MQPRALLFDLLSGRSRWLSEEQAGFAELLERGGSPSHRLEPVRTSAAHLALTAPEAAAFRTLDASGPEASLSGNAVALPVEMQKMAATELDHQLTTHLHRRYLGLLRTALGAPQG
jgi:flagellar basal-body rod protein FlgB